MEVRKRYFQVSEELLELLDPAMPSIDARLEAVAAALPELAVAAAAKAIAEWGRPASDITHLVVSTSSGAQMPGVDVRVASLLGLSPTVRRTMIYFQACAGGAGALRVAKDAAENNRGAGARVLVVCADVLSVMAFHAPDDDEARRRPEGIVAHALFGGRGGRRTLLGPRGAPRLRDGTTIPGTERFVTGDFSAAGVGYNLAPLEVPELVGDNIERCLATALDPLGLPSGAGAGGWNSLFWVVHPGSSTIMNSYEKALRLEPGKLAASRRAGPTVIFVLDEVVRRRRQCEWGVLVGLGPGFTAEVIALRSLATPL
ncbi:hypothetical protein SORBI_3005G134400 [Sorghum bicolor]|uniref:Chalcone/stilbene synthase N-terminal domain-containing protein n=1 Tax=Sorghum bicolor TaxID=4558 RepID=A0A1B6PTH7_SORBI|nr:hypothetical protein SORBI_3005G134400 [Sorghum bicolor]